MGGRLFKKFVFATALAAAGVSVAYAQDEQRQARGFRGLGGPGGFAGGLGGIGGMRDLLEVAQIPEVQAHVKVNEDEKGYLAILVDEIREKDQEAFRAMREAGGGGGGQNFFAQMQERMRERNKDVEDKLTEMLGKERVQRLKEVRIQLAGPTILFSPEIRQEIGLADEDMTKIGEAMAEAQDELQEIIRQKQEEKVKAVLTDDQKSKWEAMRGSPIDFKVKAQRRGRGRGDGPGGGRGRGDGNRRNNDNN